MPVDRNPANDSAGAPPDREATLRFRRAEDPAPALAASLRKAGTADDERLAGTAGRDTLLGRRGDDTLLGRAGDDVIRGGGGADRLSGGAGDDRLVGGPGDDTLIGGPGTDTLIGGGGADVFAFDDGALSDGADTIRRFRSGVDKIDLTGLSTVDRMQDVGIFRNGNLTLLEVGEGMIRVFGDAPAMGDFVIRDDGDAGVPAPSSIRRAGTAANENFSGTGASDTLIGRGGSDTLRGLGGDDVLRGGGGGDRLIGGGGNDRLIGGGGNDTVIGGGGNDFLKGNAGEDVLRGGARNDTLAGGGRNDTLIGGGGDDVINGDAGNDMLRGGAGNDRLAADAGVDTLVGGGGSDIYVVRLVNGQLDGSVDIVRDFRYAQGDKVGLTEALSGVSFDRLDEVVRATPTGPDTIISVNRGAGFQDVLRLEGVTFQTEQLISYGFTAPPGNGAFFSNPYGFENNSFTTSDPAATRDGAHVVWVDRLNLDGDPNDRAPTNRNDENGTTRDVFIMNTETGAIQRVSQRINQDVEAASPAISADGRMVAYIQGFPQENNNGEVFVRDMAFPNTQPILVSVDDDGFSFPGSPISNVNRGGLNGSFSNESVSLVDISGDGRKVVFVTTTDLSGRNAIDNNGQLDVYLRDLDTERTTLISGLGGFAQGVAQPYPQGFNEGQGDIVKISENGRYVAFASNASFVGAGDTDGLTDIYLFDTVARRFLLVSSPEAGGTTSFDMSADGSRIVFATEEAAEPDDTNGLSDIYVADIDLASFTVTSRTRVSEAEGGFQLRDDDSFAPIISPDGSRVAFLSNARDLTNFDPSTPFNSGGGVGGSSFERLYVLDLDSGEISVPDAPRSRANADSLIPHAVLTDDGFIFRQSVDAAPGTSRTDTDTIAIAGLTAPPSADLPDTPAEAVGIARVERFTAVRSEIDAPGDVDVFVYRDNGGGAQISISVEGVDTGAGTLTDPFLRVFNNGANFPLENDIDRFGFNDAIDDDDGVGRNAFIRVDPQAFAQLFIEVSGFGDATGSYRLTINQDPLPPFDDFG